MSSSLILDVTAILKEKLDGVLSLPNDYVIDFSMLGSFHTLDLSYTNVKDVSMLGDVHTLNLFFTKVVDVTVCWGMFIL